MWWKLWLIWLLVIVGLTTMPWSNYVGHSHWSQVRWIPFYDHPLAFSDLCSNVILFVPFGLCLGRALSSWRRKTAWALTLLLSATISTSAEFFQVYCHNRTPSTTDICTNVLGAMVGAWLAMYWLRPKELSSENIPGEEGVRFNKVLVRRRMDRGKSL